VTLCEASQVTDRRRILNFLADETSEKNGLRTNAHGSLTLIDGWQKELEDASLSSTSRPRLGGEQEFEHEAQLFEECAGKFQALNRKIQDKVQTAVRALGTHHVKLGCEITRLENRGITLGQFRVFMKKVKAWALSSSSGDVSWDTLCGYELVEKYLKPTLYLTSESQESKQLSYVETVSTGIQSPRFKIDFSYGSRVKDMNEAVEWHAEARQLGDACVYWWDITAYRHHVKEENGRGESFSPVQRGWREQLHSDCDGTVFLWVDGTSHINRIWRMKELQICFQTAALIDFSCNSGALACTVSFPDGGWEFGRFHPSIARELLAVDVRACRAKHAMDVDEILAWFEEAKGGISRFHDRIVRVAAGPVLRDAHNICSRTELHEIQRICGTKGFTVNSSSLKGSLGNTAVHMAAAAGKTEALRMLLEQLADPNAQDHMCETPLHYAALTGHARCAQLLLKYGANAFAESSFGDTPSEVAHGGAAAYMGISTRAVHRLLTTWEDVENEDKNAVAPIAAAPCKSMIAAAMPTGSARAAVRHARQVATESTTYPQQ